MEHTQNVYSGMDRIPKGNASDTITEGCLVLEGGAWRGIYTQGALDALMEAGINFRTTIGVSAGALSAIGYLSGQIGWAPRINLTYRGDPEYTGLGALKHDHGVTGFSYLFGTLMQQDPLNKKRFFDPARRLVVVATNISTGKPEYFEKGKCRIFRAIRASATVPYVSRPVVIDGQAYLDGGCSDKIPYGWALKNCPGKIMIIRTRDLSYRKTEKKENAADRLLYRRYPELVAAMDRASVEYNEIIDLIEKDTKAGRTFCQAPEEPVEISRFEGDVEKLGALYERGYSEMKKRIPELKAYLAAPMP
ncbi:MAG: patatin family protein [Eubacteriales bacterium]|jgi:predicted patatin/cPLA2 family phospholipase